MLYNAERSGEGKAPIAIGIGIATGEMVAGYTGTQQRATYTCIGDTVNRAILLDGAAREGLGSSFAPDAMGPVVFKGKSEPTAVYALGPVPLSPAAS